MKKKNRSIILGIVVILFLSIAFIIISLVAENIRINSYINSHPELIYFRGDRFFGAYELERELLDHAVVDKDPGLCSNIFWWYDNGDYYDSPELNQYYCRIQYAILAQDVEYCKSLSSKVEFDGESAKMRCIKALAPKLKDSTLCEELRDVEVRWPSNEELVEQCIEDVQNALEE